MSSRLHQKIASMLGLLAILMVTLAPTVSQVLAATRVLADLDTALCSVHAALADEAPPSPDDSRSLAGHWHACGYCGLFAHAPALPITRVALAVAVAAAEERAAVRFETHRRPFILDAAQPRAPPILSLI